MLLDLRTRTRYAARRSSEQLDGADAVKLSAIRGRGALCESQAHRASTPRKHTAQAHRACTPRKHTAQAHRASTPRNPATPRHALTPSDSGLQQPASPVCVREMARRERESSLGSWAHPLTIPGRCFHRRTSGPLLPLPLLRCPTGRWTQNLAQDLARDVSQF